MLYPEAAEQMKLIQWARSPIHIEAYPGLELLHNNPNTQMLTNAQRGRWKSMGSLPGIPDLHLPVPDEGGCHSLYIEMKAPKYKTHKNGGLSEEQVTMIAALRANGHKVAVCHHHLEAINVLKEYLS